MKKNRKTSTLVGVLFLIAMIASLVGGSLLETAQSEPNPSNLATGIILEIVNALAVLGIGILLFPVINKFHKNAARFYLSFRIMEAIACLVAPLVLIAFSNSTELRMLFTGKLIPLFFCSGAIVLYSILYLYRLVPRFISVWGFIGVAGIIVLNLSKFESCAGMLLALPIILNEIFLGIWLIVKGFNKPKANVYAI